MLERNHKKNAIERFRIPLRRFLDMSHLAKIHEILLVVRRRVTTPHREFPVDVETVGAKLVELFQDISCEHITRCIG